MDEIVEGKKNQPLVILIAIMLVVLVLIILISRDMEQIRAFIGSSGWVGILVAVLLYGLLGASPIPSEPLTVLLSTIYGPFTATLVAGFGNMLAALFEYFLGERLSNVTSFVTRKEKLPFGLGRFPVDSPVFLIAARMLPGYGPKFVSLIAGMYRVPMYRYLWTTAVPTFLGAAIFAYGGFGLINLSNLQ